jgi:hypothetical protein
LRLLSQNRIGAGGISEHIEMKMSVILASGEVGTVLKDNLDDSIRGKKIIAFLRSSGWVQIDRDPMRKAQRPLAGSREKDGRFMHTGTSRKNNREAQ